MPFVIPAKAGVRVPYVIPAKAGVRVPFVIPAKAGIHCSDATIVCVRRNDEPLTLH